MNNYVWVVLGDASGVPVYATSHISKLMVWLDSRRGNKMLRLFRLTDGVYPSKVEYCITCMLEDRVEKRRHW